MVKAIIVVVGIVAAQRSGGPADVSESLLGAGQEAAEVGSPNVGGLLLAGLDGPHWNGDKRDRDGKILRGRRGD